MFIQRKRAWWLFLTSSIFVILLLAVYLFLLSSLPDSSSIQRLKGIENRVKVIRDQWGIPHIYAQSRKDLYYTLGYLMASDRLFQMDIYRRSANGTLAEIFGASAIPLDVKARTLAFHEYAEQVIKKKEQLFSAQMLQDCNAFFKGINAFIDSGKLPYEFTLLDYRPQHFSLVDAQALTGVMGLSFSTAFKQDILFGHIKKRNPELLKLLLEDNKTPLKTSGINLNDQQLALLANFPHDILTPLMAGSNSWVVSGNRSKSGFPLLANDPHIAFSLPNIWYEAHLHTPTIDRYGHFIPLIPFPIIAHNQNLGWAITMSLVDDLDFTDETISYPKQAIKIQNQWHPITIKKSVIKVRNGKDQIISLYKTPHGPLVDKIWQAELPHISMQWSYYLPNNTTLLALFQMGEAQNITEFQNALELGFAPGLNVSYADRSGNIAWWILGKIPSRNKECDHRLIYQGEDERCLITDYISFKEHPFLINPPLGLIVSANSIPPTQLLPVNSSKKIIGDWKTLDRYQSIITLLQRKQKHDYKSLQKIQTANTNIFNHQLKQAILNLIQKEQMTTPLERNALSILHQWDEQADRNSVGMSIYAVLLRKISRYIFDDLTTSEYTIFANLAQHYRLLKKVILNNDHPLWSSQEFSTPQELTTNAFKQSISFLIKKLGPEISLWQWERLHTLEFKHPLGNIAGLSTIFNRGPYPIGGAKTHINALSGPMDNLDFKVKTGVSTRIIIDFANPRMAWSVLPLGESAHMLSSSFADQLSLFLTNKYRTMLMDSSILAQHNKRVIQFLPLKK